MPRLSARQRRNLHRPLAALADEWTDPRHVSSMRAFALSQGPHHQLLSGDCEGAVATLQDYPTADARLAEVGAHGWVADIEDAWSTVQRSAAGHSLDINKLRLWESFTRERAHILARGHDRWPANKILLQLAVEHANNSPVTQAAEAWLDAGHCDWVWLRCSRRASRATLNPCDRVLEGHTDAIVGASVLPDGNILSWSMDGTLNIWSLKGELIHELEGHIDLVRGAIVLPNGQILSWSNDHDLRLWSIDGSPQAKLSGHTDIVLGAVVLHDQRILSWSFDHTLRIWSPDGTPLLVMTQHKDPVIGAKVSRDKTIYSWTDNGTLCSWTSRGIHLAEFDLRTMGLEGVTLLPDGRLLTLGSYIADCPNQYSPKIFGTDGKLHAILEGHTGGIRGAKELSDERILSWSRDGTLRLWNRHGQPLAELRGHTDQVEGAIELADGRILSWSHDHTLRIWSNAGASIAVLTGHRNRVNGATEMSDGRLVSWADGPIHIWNSDGELVNVLDEHSKAVHGVDELPDGRLLSWSQDNHLRLWRIDRWKTNPSTLSEERHYGGRVTCNLLSDGRILTHAHEFLSKDHNARLRDSEGRTLAILAHRSAVFGATELPNQNLLTWSADNTLRLWNSNGSLETTLSGHTNMVQGVLTLQDGNIISWARDIVEPYDPNLLLWSAKGALLARLTGHEDAINGVASLSGNRILSWSSDGTLRIWAMNTGSCNVLLGHKDKVRGARVLPENQILSWSDDQSLRLWSDSGDCLATLKGHTASVSRVAILPNGSFLSWAALDRNDCSPCIWTRDGKLTARLEGHEEYLTNVQVLSDGRILSFSDDGAPRLWRSDGTPLSTLDGQNGTIFSAELTDSGHVLLRDSDRRIRLYDPGTGAIVENLPESIIPFERPAWLSAMHRTTSLSINGCTGWASDQVAGVSFLRGSADIVALWQGESDVHPKHCLRDGKLIVTLDSGDVLTLQLFSGNAPLTVTDFGARRSMSS